MPCIVVCANCHSSSARQGCFALFMQNKSLNRTKRPTQNFEVVLFRDHAMFPTALQRPAGAKGAFSPRWRVAEEAPKGLPAPCAAASHRLRLLGGLGRGARWTGRGALSGGHPGRKKLAHVHQLRCEFDMKHDIYFMV